MKESGRASDLIKTGTLVRAKLSQLPGSGKLRRPTGSMEKRSIFFVKHD